MKTKKPLTQLLDDIVAFFKEKYGKYLDYDMKQYQANEGVSADQSTVTPLHIPDCPAWARPGLVLSQWGKNPNSRVLALSASIPVPGYNEEFRGSLIELYCSFQNHNALWLSAHNSLGSMRVMTFRKEDRVLNMVRAEFIAKVNELAYSGEYDLEHFKLEEKVA